ncbi:CHASE2 domain-containing protein [Lyngbya aestuarii]|uniref:CHASE2 domain-containing protein n=1 Tax=Lyngbya aestuarii TaxID=118322 RepID=UPI00403DCF60
MWTKLKQVCWEWRGAWIAAPSITAVVILLRLAGLLQSWEWIVLDQYIRWRPLETRDDRVVIVGINEEDLRNIGQAIIPDETYAQLLEKLKARQPRAIGLDIYRDLPVEPGHQQLIAVFESTPNLIGIQKAVGDSQSQSVAPPPVLKTKGQVAANDLLTDADERVRRALLFVEDSEGKTLPSLGMYLAGLYLDAEGIALKKVEGKDSWQLGQQVLLRFQANDGGYVRAKAGGYQILLNYRGASRYFDTVSLTDILEDRVAADWGRDRVILVGAVSESYNDLYSTPYTRAPNERLAGVEIHANVTSQLVSAAQEGRPFIKSWAEPWEWLWILLWAAIGAALTWKWRYTGGVRFFSLRGGGAFILASGALTGGTYVAFLGGWWLPVIPAILAMGGAALSITAYLARTAGKIRKTFGRYLTDEVVANLLESKEGLKLGGQRQKITILTSDLRGFTSFSERLPAEEVIKVLNLYLGQMADVITSYQGTIDEFMGDGILVLFGAPTTREDDAVRAIACAVEMQLSITHVNNKLKEQGLPPLEMGIGINTGEVVVGNIGSEKRTKYGVVGSQVNLTYRIESYTLGGQIVISESTLQEAGTTVIIDGQKEVKPKGVKKPITIYEVGGIGGKYNLFLAKQEEEFFTLPQKMPIQYTFLEEKHISDALFQGSLVKLSVHGAQISLDPALEKSVPSRLSNIKLNLLNETDSEVSEDVYAKVLAKPAENGSFYIHFTAKPPAVAMKLDVLYKSLID